MEQGVLPSIAQTWFHPFDCHSHPFFQMQMFSFSFPSTTFAIFFPFTVYLISYLYPFTHTPTVYIYLLSPNNIHVVIFNLYGVILFFPSLLSQPIFKSQSLKKFSFCRKLPIKKNGCRLFTNLLNQLKKQNLIEQNVAMLMCLLQSYVFGLLWEL